MRGHPTALIADDEPLLRDDLANELEHVWPELEIVARARNGAEAIQLFDKLLPDVCFLDVKMPGISGVEAARHIRHRAHVIFVTAFDDHAVQAFEQGALDYLLKPVQAHRLADAVARLKERLASAQPANTESLLSALAMELQHSPGLKNSAVVRLQIETLNETLASFDKASLKGQIEYLLAPILHTGGGSIDKVAEMLDLSRQTIFRKLKAEGTTFQEVLDQLRLKMALEYLKSGRASVNEVAYLLGFSDPASFSRAFKRWTGYSPHNVRANPLLI